MNDETLVLTPSALLAFLNEIEELKDLDLVLNDSAPGELSVTIGDNSYVMKADPESTINVDDELIETINEIDDEGYEELVEDIENEDEEDIEGGIIKELIKTLAVGGLVRMTKNAIMKS